LPHQVKKTGFHFDMALEHAPTPWQQISLARRGADYFGMSGPTEFIAAIVLSALMIVVRVVNILHYRFDSDEPQHLHLIWGWARGFVQYRDLFDNHMPLFHIAFAPMFGVIGDRATILYQMRFLLLPMYFVAAWCTYKIGTALFCRRAGVWAVILAGLYTGYHFISLEFRTDNVWAPLWLLCITVLVTGPLSVRRALVAGLLLGLCFGVSMKSVLLLFSIAVAALLTLLLVRRRNLAFCWTHLVQCIAAFVVSTASIPATIMIFFAFKGLWRDFVYCVFDFNFLVRGAPQNSLSHRIQPIVIILIALPIILYAARRLICVTEGTGLALRRVFILMVCTSYFFAFKAFWPVRSHDDDPPFYPLVAVLCSGALLAASNKLISFNWNAAQILRRAPVPAFIAVSEIFVLLAMEPIWKDKTRRETDLLRNVLTLAKPGDYVLDCKGETVFRQRSVRPVYETITKSAIQRGLILDNAPQKCVETHTCVVATTLIRTFPPGTSRFVRRNYLRVTNNLRIAGKELKASETNPNRSEFDVTIPASYEIISPNEEVSGTLDGIRYTGARFLAAGSHTFESTSPFEGLVLLWSQAVDRGFTPFKHHTLPHG
jgi:Dolichyl-phosphate-mannose-protein mannosyltransferase